jgi:hypothetical protein
MQSIKMTCGKSRNYGDACAMAHALELVGERWSLIVVRELMFGPARNCNRPEIETADQRLEATIEGSPDRLPSNLRQTGRTAAFEKLRSMLGASN